MTNKLNFTAKDEINAISAEPLQTIKGQKITVTGINIEERPDNNGEIINVGYIKTADGSIFTTISDTVVRGLDALVDYMADESLSTVDVLIKTKKSKNGREFFLIELA